MANWGITADGLLPDQTGNSGKYLTTNGSTVSWATVSGGSSTFLALTDTPSSFSGQANKFLRVNGAENALEFATISGGGDLLSTNNLSDLTSASTARTNLGLGTIATQSSTALSGSFDFGGFKLKQETSGFALTIDSDGDDFTANRNLSFFTGDASRSVTLNGNLTVSSAATVSGTNSGDQTITLTGDVTGSGTGSFSTTIAAGTVTFAKMADLSTARLIGRTTAGTGAPEEVRFQGGIEDDGSGNLQVGAFTGDVTKSAGDSTLTIANDAVSYAKMQNVTFQRVLGRNTFSGSPGDVEEVSVSSLLDWVTATEGAILYRGVSGWDQIGDVYSDGTDLLRVSDNSPVVFDADVRGGAADLNSRLGVISNFASPNAGGIVSGQYYDNAFQGTASSTLAGAANRMDLAPYYTSVTFAIDRIGVAVSTGVASAQAKVVIYSSDANGWPDALLYETAALDCSSTGIKEATLSFTFYSGTQYWVGVRHSSTATLRTINVSSAKNLGLTSATASNYATILRRTLTFATAATDPWVFTNSDRVANVTPPSIRFRAQ